MANAVRLSVFALKIMNLSDVYGKKGKVMLMEKKEKSGRVLHT